MSDSIQITLGPTGFAARDRKQTVSVPWDEVRSITAFKRDGLTVDTVWLRFALQDSRALEVSEDMDGWDALLRAAVTALPGMPAPEAWLPSIIRPPFAANTTLLYQAAGIAT